MKTRAISLSILVLMTITLSCNFITGSSLHNGPATGTSAPPLQAGGNGPGGLIAEATSPDSVRLTWQAMEGAQSYRIVVSTNGGASVALIDLDPSVTSYEDFLATPGSRLTYAVEAVGASGSIGQSVVSVTTAARQPQPITVQVKVDGRKTSSATIGPEGGSLSVTDAKGLIYKLDIPPGALAAPTEITLTAVKEIGGWPLDGEMLGAVEIEPAGLSLDSTATLSITLPVQTTEDKFLRLGFGYSGDGEEFHLQPGFDAMTSSSFAPGRAGHAGLAVDSPASQILNFFLSQLNGNGVGTGSAGDAGELVRSHPPSDNGAALDQKSAAALAAQSEVPDAFRNLKTRNQADVDAFVVGAAVSTVINAAENCDQLKDAVKRVDSWRIRAGLDNVKGADPAKLKAEENALWESLTNKIKDVVNNADEECQKKGKDMTSAAAEAGCLESLLAKIANPPNPFFEDLRSKMESKYGDQAVTGHVDALADCLPAYTASEGSNGYQFSGTICSLTKPFTLSAAGVENFAVDFTPSNALGGSVTAAFSGSGCTDQGAGTYIVNLSSGGTGTVIATFPASTVSCPGISKTNAVVQVFKITPLSAETAACGNP